MADHTKNPRYYGNNNVNTSNKRKPKSGTSGIYKITNDRTGETYIGQSKNIEKRIRSHENELRQGTHHNRGMQSDYLRGDTFTSTILEKTSSDRQTLHQKEEKYISQYNTFNQGYNQTPGGQYDKYQGYYGHGGGRLGSNSQQTNSNKTQNINDISSYTRNYKKSSNVDLATAQAINDGFKKVCIGILLILFVAFIIFLIGCSNPYLLTINNLVLVLLCLVGGFILLILLAVIIEKLEGPEEKAAWITLKYGGKKCLICNNITHMSDEKCPKCGHKFYNKYENPGLASLRKDKKEEEKKTQNENKENYICYIPLIFLDILILLKIITYDLLKELK